MKKSAILSSQSALLSERPVCTALWSSLYTSHVAQAASSLAQERTVGCEDVITGDILEQLFIDAIEDMLEQLFIDAIEDITSPVINSSSSVALLTSSEDGVTEIVETDGVETQEGGPNELE